MNQAMVDKLTRWGAERVIWDGRDFIKFYPANVGRTPENVAGLASELGAERARASRAIRAVQRAYEAEIGYSHDPNGRVFTIGKTTYTSLDATRAANTYREIVLIRYDVANDALTAANIEASDYIRAILQAIRNA